MRIDVGLKNNDIAEKIKVSDPGIERKVRVDDIGEAGQAAEEEQEKIPGETVEAAAEAANKIAHVFNTTLKFEVHDKTKLEMIKVVDTRTDMVIREMPPREILDMVARIWEAIGVFVDKKV